MTTKTHWKKAWAAAATPEQRRELSDTMRYAVVASMRREYDEAVAGKEQLEKKRCRVCNGPLPSFTRSACPPCAGKRNRP